ncbi:hypothetical protein [Janibacter sp. G1551]|uniref:hypothetical protein n=1 Tax=Janibacter sp. G1551 TaxID=3420440 RepID=UPI003D04EDCA
MRTTTATLATIAAIALTGCGSDDTSDPAASDTASTSASSTASDTTTPTSSSTTTTAPTSGTATSDTATTTATGTTTEPTANGCAEPIRARFTTHKETYMEAPVSYQRLEATDLCGKGAAALAKTFNAQVSTLLQGWKKSIANGPERDHNKGGFTLKGEMAVNEGTLVVATTRAHLDLGGAHGNTLLDDVTVQTDTGTVWSDEAMVAAMKAPGGPRWDIDRELTRQGTRETGSTQPLTLADVNLYPTKGGMIATADHGRVYASVYGAVTMTLPWNTLVGPKDSMPFILPSWR